MQARRLKNLLLAAGLFGLILAPLTSCSYGGAAPEGEKDRPQETVIFMAEGHLFKPASVRVRPGEKVLFINQDKDLHALTITGHEDLLDNVFLDPGQEHTMTIPTHMPPGVLDLRCTIHIDMMGRIIVEAP